MPRKPTKLTRPWVIVCEGQGDSAFFRHLMQERQLPQFDVTYPGETEEIESGGGQGFSRKLTALTTQTHISAILVVSDNDDDPVGSFREVQEQIRKSGRFPVPDEPLQVLRGTGGPAVVILMLPWTGEPGNLEALCLEAACAHQPHLRECLDEYSQCVGVETWPISKTQAWCTPGAVKDAEHSFL